MATDNLERSLAGTPAMEEVEKMRYENHTSTKGRSQQKTPSAKYAEGYGRIQWHIKR